VATSNDVIDLLDFTWKRLLGRVEGMTDEEYLWEPVPGCWTVRRGADGRLRPDRGFPPPRPEPFTTIAWIVAHIAGREPATGQTWPLLVGERPRTVGPLPATAAEARHRLADAHRGWRDALAGIPPASLDVPMAELGDLARSYAAGVYAQSTGLALVLHWLDEHIHHAAQIGTIRDLYRASPEPARFHSPAHPDPVVDAVLRGDEDALVAAVADAAGAIERARSEHPDAVARAVAVGGPPALRRLVELGFPIDAPGAVPSLHLAVWYDEPDTVALLLDLGADPEATDPLFRSTPRAWAVYAGHPGAAAALDPG
jgi:hypothetical protein